MKTTATAPDMGTSAAGTLDHKVEAEPIKLLKRIGSKLRFRRSKGGEVR